MLKGTKYLLRPEIIYNLIVKTKQTIKKINEKNEIQGRVLLKYFGSC